MSGDFIQLAVENSGQRYMITISRNATVADLNRQTSKIVFKGELSSDEFYLTWGGTPLDNQSETLKKLNIPDKAELGVFLRLHGGSSSSLQPLPGYISVTSSEPCSMSLDDDPDEKRAKMPCNCVISVESMTEYLNGALKSGNFRFFCPNCKGKEWHYFVIRHVLSASLTETELKEIDATMNKNFTKSPDMQQCPFCNSYCKRDMSKTFWNKNRVVCPLCSKRSGSDVEFCWCCLESWKGGLESCGNDGCDGTDSRCRVLVSCPTKTIGHVSDVPSVRGCVQCGNLIYHIDKCKHMNCKCGYGFCFVCLKPHNTKTQSWECGGAYEKCPVAPRQKNLDETPEKLCSIPTAQPNSSSNDNRCTIL